MKITVAQIILIMALTVGPLYAADIDITIHVDDDYRPFSYAEDGEPKGIYIEILKTASSRLEGYNVQLVPIPWKRGKLMMERGQGFGLTPVFYHGHDWPYLYPYSISYYTETIIAVCRVSVFDRQRTRWPHDYV